MDWVELSLTRVLHDAGLPYYYIAVIQDLTTKLTRGIVTNGFSKIKLYQFVITD